MITIFTHVVRPPVPKRKSLPVEQFQIICRFFPFKISQVFFIKHNFRCFTANSHWCWLNHIWVIYIFNFLGWIFKIGFQIFADCNRRHFGFSESVQENESLQSRDYKYLPVSLSLRAPPSYVSQFINRIQFYEKYKTWTWKKLLIISNLINPCVINIITQGLIIN